jgi:gamma-glutamylcyclotransferase (GGCT)/AIG2-like uncharacterized protein YtfP
MKGMYYFAYGSNLHPARLRERAPGARVVARALLRGHELRFHKRGRDGSGKCDAWTTGASRDLVHGVIYRISARERHRLDQVEGVGQGYDRVQLRVSARGRCRVVFAYLARPAAIVSDLQPYGWYLDYLLCGARYHGLPGRYVKGISKIPRLRDLSSVRRRRHRGVIARHVRPAQSP